MHTQRQNRLFQSLELMLDAVFLVDMSGRVTYVNAACERIFGYTPAEMIGHSMIELVVPEDRTKTREEAVHIMAGHPRIGFENRFMHKDGRIVHIMWSARWSEADQLRIGVARDVSEQKRAEEMQAATYAVSEAAHNANDLDTLFRTIHRIIARLVPVAALAVATRNRKTKALGFPYQQDHKGKTPVVQDAIAGQYCDDVIRSGQATILRDDALAPAGGDSFWLFMPLITQQVPIGALVLKAHPGATYTTKDKELLNFVSAQIATAIERGQLKAELLRAAQYDELTGLPNRRLFHDRLERALARSRRKHVSMALLYIDIDDFKNVNDTLGHAAGDVLLQEIARRLECCVRNTDTVSRLGGDEFVVILEEVHGSEDATNVASKIHNTLAQPFDLDGTTLRTRASIGLALCPEHGSEADQLLRHADSGMYTSKTHKET
jgi:diguanylate cyclase (GGDEF)-like protein/PAS domain S-box-containing protein